MSDKPPLLFLAHRIPYPPNKGDKIRSWNILVYLAEYFSIYLGCFVDDPDDWQHCAMLRRLCADAVFIARRPRMHKVLSARGLVSGDPLSVSYYRSARLRRWVAETVSRQNIERAFLFCSPMAQFLDAPGVASRVDCTVIDFVDVDSEKWRQYAVSGGLGSRWLYTRESDRLLRFEAEAASRARASLFVSEAEADLFRARAPQIAGPVRALSNGVDTAYFRPDPALPNPYPSNTPVLVFTGAMDYRPNAEAVQWFVAEVFPLLRQSSPLLQLWIVGGNPSPGVRALAASDGVVVTGRVEDIRPYLQHAFAAVAPMRIARGIQNKVLEALAMATPVVATAAALEGLDVASIGLGPADTPAAHLEQLLPILEAPEPPDRGQLRHFVERHYSWPAHLGALPTLLGATASLGHEQRGPAAQGPHGENCDPVAGTE